MNDILGVVGLQQNKLDAEDLESTGESESDYWFKLNYLFKNGFKKLRKVIVAKFSIAYY